MWGSSRRATVLGKVIFQIKEILCREYLFTEDKDVYGASRVSPLGRYDGMAV